MKKILMAVAAFGMLLTSCQDDLDLVQNAGESAQVSFSVGTPEIATRAYSDGLTANVLQYAVYDSEGNILSDLTETDATINGSTTVNLQLTTGDTYSVIFWAAAEDAPYTVNFDEKKMTVSYDGAKSNDETRDAFYKYHTFTVTGAQTETIELKRPFAQLNIGTSDYTASENAGYVPTTSAVTVKNIYKTLSLVNGDVTDETEAVFAANAIPVGEQFPVAGYEYLAMNYLLVNTEKEVVDVEFTYADANNDAKTRTVGSVPVQRNYRTNIYGQLLTSDVDINVEIKPEYDEDDKYGAIDGQVYVKVSNALEFNEAFGNENVDIIILTEDIVLNESLTRAGGDPELVVSKGKAVTIDLAGNTLSSTSTGTGKNYNMFDVRGTMTVKNGTMEYEHKGDNMGWSNSTNLFNVTDGGVLNIEGVTAKNLGGSDMAFVAHLNNWGEVTLNVKNSVLESPYIAVRVFNSGNDMNNVTIKGSTLKGTRSFWVQNYTMADFGNNESKFEAHKALLNFDIFNDEANPSSDDNTFIYDEENKLGPVCYGFTDDIYFDQYGNEISQYIPILDAEGNVVEGVAYDPASATEVGGETVYTTVVVTANEGLTWVANEVDNGDSFEGKTINLDTDIILPEGTNWEPIGDNRTEKAFSGTFDGQNHLISGAKKSSFDGSVFGSKEGWGIFSLLDGATVKNLRLENEVFASYTVISGTVAGYAQNTTFENIEISNSKISGYNWYTGGVVGWASGNCTFKDIKLDETVSVGSLWDSHGQSAGGIAGGVSGSGTYLIEDCDIACVLDVINDVTSNYKWYIYRVAGMIIGNTNTTETSYNTVVTATATNVTCKNVTVTYGKWMNYHYCEEYGNRGWGRVEASDYVSFGIPEDHTHSEGKTHYECIPFDQLFGGSSNGSGHYPVKGLASFEGVTVNYPAEYTCSLCGKQHNVQ